MGTNDATVPTNSNYATQGPPSTWDVKMKADAPHPHECYILAPSTCTDDELEGVLNGTAKVYNYIYGASAPKPGQSGGPPKKGAAPRLAEARVYWVQMLLMAGAASLLLSV